MSTFNNRETRITNRGNIVESPANTFTWTPSQEAVLKTGITSFEIVASTDGSNIADITITFLADNLATYANTYSFDIIISGDYILRTTALTAPVANVISDSMVFNDADEYNSFVSQLSSDLSIEINTPDVYY